MVGMQGSQVASIPKDGMVLVFSLREGNAADRRAATELGAQRWTLILHRRPDVSEQKTFNTEINDSIYDLKLWK